MPPTPAACRSWAHIRDPGESASAGTACNDLPLYRHAGRLLGEAFRRTGHELRHGPLLLLRRFCGRALLLLVAGWTAAPMPESMGYVAGKFARVMKPRVFEVIF